PCRRLARSAMPGPGRAPPGRRAKRRHGRGIADRAVRGPAAASPHGAAPAAHDGGAAAPLAGRAAVSLAPGLAALRARLLGRPPSVFFILAPARRALDASTDGAADLCLRHLAVPLADGL